MKEIKLSNRKKSKNQHLNLIALVDDEDYEVLSKLKWWTHASKYTRYARFNEGVYPKIYPVQMHRVIMGCKKGDGLIVDHKDGNGLNNQKSNLRIVTRAQNNTNRRVRKVLTSPYLGVHLKKMKWKNKKTGEIICTETIRWQASIRTNKKTIYLGLFKTEEEGALAYNAAAIIHHGEFANLNIIPQ